MAKIKQLREMNAEQLVHELRETQETLFKLRFQASTERLDAPTELKKLRKTIAQIKTLQREAELANGSSGGES